MCSSSRRNSTSDFDSGALEIPGYCDADVRINGGERNFHSGVGWAE